MPRRYNAMPPLTQKAERALRKTIARWERRAAGDNLSGFNAESYLNLAEESRRQAELTRRQVECPLCAAFPANCPACPVYQRMPGSKDCFDVPAYGEWNHTPDASPEETEAAKKVARFLRDTLRLGLAAREK